MNFKEDFPMLNKDIIYFDNGATTFKPNSVIDVMNDYSYENVRDKVKEFINAKHREEIVFTSGATESLNMIAKGFFEQILEEGDEILITDAEHASNVLPWFRLAKIKNAHIKYIPLDKTFHVTLENVKRSITSKTKVIAIAEITNVVGDIRPIKEICDYAHKNNIFVVVDGAQSIPHKKCNVQDMDADFLVFSAHKMCGPTGVGVLYGKQELLESMEPLNLGGGMNESFDNENEIYLKELPTRLEAGTPNIAGVIGFGAAIDYLNRVGMDEIRVKESELKRYMVSKLERIRHIDIINPECDSGIVAFNIDGIFPQDVAVYLDKYNVCVRAGNHCAKILKKAVGVKNTVRASLYFYNTKEEIDDFVELLKDRDKIMKEMI